jgi:hypothetical protein
MKQFRDTPYYVTEDGKVFRHYPEWIKKYPFKNSFVTRKIPERWKSIKPNKRKDGYCQVNVCIGGINKKYGLHRMVAELYVPGYFEGAHVDHIDCNVNNNHYSNLQWCTATYNTTKKDNPNYPLFSS